MSRELKNTPSNEDAERAERHWAANAKQERILTYFAAGREEILLRIKMRDTCLGAYGAIVAACFTFARILEADARTGALLIIPYLSLAFSLLVAHHHGGIAALSSYCSNLIKNSFDEDEKNGHFEWSKIYQLHRGKSATKRALGQGVILLSPAAISLWMNWPEKFARPSINLDAWFSFFGIVALLWAAIILVTTENYRDSLISKASF